MQNQKTKPILEWTYSEHEWNEFVDIEKANKKEDNIYFGVAILIVAPIILMLSRDTSFTIALIFSAPFAILIPFLRMKFSYKHLQKDVKSPIIKIFENHIEINEHKIEVAAKKKRIKELQIIESKNNTKLLEVDVQWITRKGPTNDEYRIPIPKGQLAVAEKLVADFNHPKM